MKIVFASTLSQEEEICERVRYIYSNVFPLYFTDDEICQFERLKVLYPTDKHFKEFGTLKDAFLVMASIQTLISILESSQLDDQYAEVFNRNATNLQEFGLFFPFEFDQFAMENNMRNAVLSIYTKADNELLI